jgi:hypothetical protein
MNYKMDKESVLCYSEDDIDYLLLPSIAREQTKLVDWLTISSVHPSQIRYLHHVANIETEKGLVCGCILMTPRHYYAFTTNSRQNSIFLLCFSVRNKEKIHCYKTDWSTRKKEKKALASINWVFAHNKGQNFTAKKGNFWEQVQRLLFLLVMNSFTLFIVYALIMSN